MLTSLSSKNIPVDKDDLFIAHYIPLYKKPREQLGTGTKMIVNTSKHTPQQQELQRPTLTDEQCKTVLASMKSRIKVPKKGSTKSMFGFKR